MANMCGFDLIFELSPRAIVELVRPLLEVNGVRYDPPADIPATNIPLIGGQLHHVLTDLSVNIGPNATISIVFSFARGSVIGRPGRPDFTSLRGNITINSRLSLDRVPKQPTRRAVTLHLRTAQVRARIPGATEVEPLFSAGWLEAIRLLTADPSFILPFEVDPRAEASLNPPVFHEVRLGSVSNEWNQSLVLFANLLSGARGRGDLEAWQTTTLDHDDDFSLLISPQLFHAMVFKPQAQSQLRVTDGDLLPPTCGRAESVPYPARPTISITRIADTMRDGRIEVEIRGHERAGEDGDALGFTDLFEVHGSLTMDVLPPNQIIPRWRTDSAGGGSRFGYGWYLFAILVNPIFYAAIGGRAAAVDEAARATPISFRPRLIQLPDIDPLQLRSAEITSEHLRLGGSVRMAARRSPYPNLQLSHTLMITSRESMGVSSDYYRSTECPEGDYYYELWRQHQLFTCRPFLSLASLPVSYQWQIRTVGGGAPSVIEAGTIEREAECFVPDTVPGRRVNRTVRIEGELSDSGALTLRNRPEDGKYVVSLSCTAIDADDHRLEQQVQFEFNGDHIVIGSRTDGESIWERDFAECRMRTVSAAGMVERMRAMGGRMYDQTPIPHWILAHRPPPWELAAFIGSVSKMKDVKRAETMINHAIALYGSSILTSLNDAPEFLLPKIQPEPRPGKTLSIPSTA